MGDIGTGTVNSSSKDSSSISESSSTSGSFQAAITGDSKGGVSVTSNASSFTARSGRFDQSHVDVELMRLNSWLTDVAVITKRPKTKSKASTG